MNRGRVSTPLLVFVAFAGIALITLAAALKFPGFAGWLTGTGWPVAMAYLASAAAFVSTNTDALLTAATTVFACFAKILAGILQKRSVAVERIGLGPFVSLAFGVYVLLCVPVAFIAHETLSINGLPWLRSVLAAFVGVFGTVDFAGAKMPTLGEAIERLEDSIAVAIGTSISERAIAESASIVAKLARKFTADTLEEELVQLGVALADVRAARQQTPEERLQRRILASMIVRKNTTYARTIAKTRLFP